MLYTAVYTESLVCDCSYMYVSVFCVPTAITCSGLSDPTNGMVNFAVDTTSPFDYQTRATYSCNSGYGLTSGDTVRTCEGSRNGPGEWTGTAPFCEGKSKNVKQYNNYI